MRRHPLLQDKITRNGVASAKAVRKLSAALPDARTTMLTPPEIEKRAQEDGWFARTSSFFALLLFLFVIMLGTPKNSGPTMADRDRTARRITREYDERMDRLSDVAREAMNSPNMSDAQFSRLMREVDSIPTDFDSRVESSASGSGGMFGWFCFGSILLLVLVPWVIGLAISESTRRNLREQVAAEAATGEAAAANEAGFPNFDFLYQQDADAQVSDAVDGNASVFGDEYTGIG
jgi:uncharacterized membrane protein